MATFNHLYKSGQVSVLLISSEYDADYREKDYNPLPAVSFPLRGGFRYKSGTFNVHVDSNLVLIEKGDIEFDVTKFSEYGCDMTLSFQFYENYANLMPGILPNGKAARTLRRNLQIEGILRRFLSTSQDGDKLLKDEIINELLIGQVFAGELPVTKGSGQNPWQNRKIDTAKDYMYTCCSEDIFLEDISGVVNTSPFHFSRLFKQATGYAPYEYLIHIRIFKARELLKKGSSETSTALETGFNSVANFSYRFKKITGIAPYEYKKSKNSKMFLPYPDYNSY